MTWMPTITEVIVARGTKADLTNVETMIIVDLLLMKIAAHADLKACLEIKTLKTLKIQKFPLSTNHAKL